uniref:C-type lectin domain-containing protein n=1 Tax=Ascaris lumbricoides TaxID=6252 RepID=A0A0M3IJV6_ASCLU
LNTGSVGEEGRYKCPENWVLFKSTKSCYKVVRGIYEYKQASGKCRSENAYLASITTRAETDFVNALFGKNEMYWIGLNKFSGKWEWEDGTTLNYTNWREGEPNECCGNPPACVIVNYKNDIGKWDDGSCRYRIRPFRMQSFVCKKSAILMPFN